MNKIVCEPKICALTILLTVFFLTTLPSVRASASGLSVPLYNSPTLDGVISTAEYPVIQIDEAWGKLYAVHDANCLTLGIRLQNSVSGIQLLFNKGGSNDTILTVNTLRYCIDRSGFLKYYYGGIDKWIKTNTSDVSISLRNETSYWTIELSIALSIIGVTSNIGRMLGFAVIVSGASFNYSWPNGVMLNNPSTWGAISSPDNWATKVDICLDIALNRRSLITGSDLTLVAVITNSGDAPIPDYEIKIMLDNDLKMNSTGSRLGLKTPLEKTDRIRYEKIFSNVANGTHTIKVNVTGLGVYYDANKDNNAKIEHFTARYAEIRVSVTPVVPGIVFEFNGRNQTITGEGEVLFYSSIGSKIVKAQKIYSPLQGLRYVFAGWSDDSTSSNPELVINVADNMDLTAKYRKEYLVNLGFVDRNNVTFQPLFYVCTLPNNTVYSGDLNSLWMWVGDLRITVVNYSGINVLDEIKIYAIHGPQNIRLTCKVSSGVIKILDPLSTPIQGADVTVIFMNNTQVKYVTGSDGTINMSRIAGGKVRLTVSNLGYSTNIELDLLTENEATIVIPVSLNIVLIIVVVMVAIAFVIVYKIFWKREKPSAAKRKTEEYEFEEL